MLPLIVDTLENVAEAFRTEYEEHEGKFRLKVEGLEDTTGLKSALQKERQNAREAAAQVKAFQKLGKTPDEIAALLESLDLDEDGKPRNTGNPDPNKSRDDAQKLLKQHQDKWTKREQEILARAEAAEKRERHLVVNTQLLAALGKQGATEEGVDLLPDRLAARIKYEQEGDERVLRIMQADGVTPMAGSGPEGEATFDDLAKEASTKWSSLFKGSGQSGSGTRPGGSGAQSKKRSEMNAKEAHDFIKTHGQSAYLKLPK